MNTSSAEAFNSIVPRSIHEGHIPTFSTLPFNSSSLLLSWSNPQPPLLSPHFPHLPQNMKLIKTQIHSIFSKLSKSKNRIRAHSPLHEPLAATRSSSSDESIAPKSVLRHCVLRTPSPSASVANLFSLFDSDGSGKITKPELEAVLRRLGSRDPPTGVELSLMVAEIDRDGDGCISLDELSTISMAALGPPVAGEELLEAFVVFDMDGDGIISAEELFGVFVALGDGGCTIEDCRRMIGSADSDGDGLVGFADFTRMMDKTEMSVRP